MPEKQGSSSDQTGGRSKAPKSHIVKGIHFVYDFKPDPDVETNTNKVIDAWMKDKWLSDGTFKDARNDTYRPCVGQLIKGGENHKTPQATVQRGVRQYADVKPHITVTMISKADLERPKMVGHTVHIYTKVTKTRSGETIEYDKKEAALWAVLSSLPPDRQKSLERKKHVILEEPRTRSPEASQGDTTRFTDAPRPQKGAWSSGTTVATITEQLQRTKVADPNPAIKTGTDKNGCRWEKRQDGSYWTYDSKGKAVPYKQQTYHDTSKDKGKGVATDTSDSKKSRSKTQVDQGSDSRAKHRSRDQSPSRPKVRNLDANWRRKD